MKRRRCHLLSILHATVTGGGIPSSCYRSNACFCFTKMWQNVTLGANQWSGKIVAGPSKDYLNMSKHVKQLDLNIKNVGNKFTDVDDRGALSIVYCESWPTGYRSPVDSNFFINSHSLQLWHQLNIRLKINQNNSLEILRDVKDNLGIHHLM